MLSSLRRITFGTQVLIGLVLGVVLGLVARQMGGSVDDPNWLTQTLEVIGSSFVSLLRQISGKIEWLYSLNVTRRGPQAWPEHRDIIAAIDAGQEAKAAEVMGQHVRRSRDSYFAMMADRPA